MMLKKMVLAVHSAPQKIKSIMARKLRVTPQKGQQEGSTEPAEEPGELGGP